jgi:hypothetical protein
MKLGLGVVCLFCTLPLLADARLCAICGAEFGATVYVVTDKVRNEKKQICHECSGWPRDGYLCGLPVKRDYTELPDGRSLCSRDARTAILNEEEAVRVCEEVQDALDRLFSRFLTFPSAKMDIDIVDRVNLRELFKFPGNDYECPNALGYMQCKTNKGQVRYDISLLSGLPLADFKAVCAHEFTHAWLAENVPAARKKTLGHDANEGFCELMAYLLMQSQGEKDQMKSITHNRYTRGQIDLFIEAENRYGFNEVVEWIKYGVDPLLRRDDLNRVRYVEIPGKKPAPDTSSPHYAAARTPSSLVLKGISWAQNRPLAVINDRTFGLNEQGKVQLGQSNVVIRCLAIRTNSAVVQIDGATGRQELFLRER